MIFRKEFLRKIEKRDISIAFRQWRKLSIVEGRTLKTPVGVIKFNKIKVIKKSAITKTDAVKAGFSNLEELMKDLSGEGDIYKIHFTLIGPDPRLKLRLEKSVSGVQKEQLLKKLMSLDQRGSIKHWVLPVLEHLEKNEGTPSILISEKLGYEQIKLKLNIRKLKNLGLTISLGTGYKLSPRGRFILKLLKKYKDSLPL